MYFNKKKIIFFICLAFIGCSVNNDALTSRFYHSNTSKYNILYNGNLLYDKAILELENNNKDVFWERLPLEKIKIKETESLEDRLLTYKEKKRKLLKEEGEESEKDTLEAKQTSFERAEDKAVKSIQKHSMNIGYERNIEMDQAYLLLGKTRYYTGRFRPAIEAFNYIVENFPEFGSKYENIMWKARSNIKLRNTKTAIDILLPMLNQGDIPKRLHPFIYTTLATAYETEKNYEKMLDYLMYAIVKDSNKDRLVRNTFILAQMYMELGETNEARVYFEKARKIRGVPYKYKIHSKVKLIETDSSTTVYDRLSELCKISSYRENKDYLRFMHYSSAKLEMERDSIGNAIKYHKLSIKNSATDSLGREINYIDLGDINIGKEEFVLAKKYYDSAIAFNKDRKKISIRKVKRLHKSLIDFVKYDSIAKACDSIIRMTKLSKKDIDSLANEYAEKTKIQLKKEKELKIIEATKIKTKPKKRGGNWVFYNTRVSVFGRKQFKKKWGDRILADNWRFKIMSSEDLNYNSVDSTSVKGKMKIIKPEDIDYYSQFISSISESRSKLEEVKFDRNEAYYQLGLIYRNKLNKNMLSSEKLEELLQLEPNAKIILPVYYILYETYKDMENIKRSDFYKNRIISEFPNSIYALKIQNKGNKYKDDKSVEDEYKKLYASYKQGSYDEVIKNIDIILVNIANSSLIPKFELLKAYSIGKMESVYVFKSALEYVALNYANTIEGEHAKKLIIKIK